MFCPDVGPVDLCHAENFQRSLTPKGGSMGGQKNFPPLPPQNPIVKPPQNCAVMSDFVSPTNRENLVKFFVPVFFIGPFENMGLLYEPYV